MGVHGAESAKNVCEIEKEITPFEDGNWLALPA
jgi:hypothetical protein